MTSNSTEKVRRYIVIHEQSGRIVRRGAGTHAMMQRICERMDAMREFPGTYVYDDASAAADYRSAVA